MGMINADVVSKLDEVLSKGLVRGLGEPKPGGMCVEAAVCYVLGLQHGDRPTCTDPSVRVLSIGLNDSHWSSNKARADGLKRLAVCQLGTSGTLDANEFAKRVAELAIRTCVAQALRAAASVIEEPHKSKLLECADECETVGSAQAANAARAAKAANAANAAYAANAAAGVAYAARAAKAANAANAAAYAAKAANAANAVAYAANVANAANAAAYAANAANAAAHVDAAVGDKILADFANGVADILIEMGTPGSKYIYLLDDVELPPKPVIPQILKEKPLFVGTQPSKHELKKHLI